MITITLEGSSETFGTKWVVHSMTWEARASFQTVLDHKGHRSTRDREERKEAHIHQVTKTYVE